MVNKKFELVINTEEGGGSRAQCGLGEGQLLFV